MSLSIGSQSVQLQGEVLIAGLEDGFQRRCPRRTVANGRGQRRIPDSGVRVSNHVLSADADGFDSRGHGNLAGRFVCSAVEVDALSGEVVQVAGVGRGEDETACYAEVAEGYHIAGGGGPVSVGTLRQTGDAARVEVVGLHQRVGGIDGGSIFVNLPHSAAHALREDVHTVTIESVSGGVVSEDETSVFGENACERSACDEVEVGALVRIVCQFKGVGAGFDIFVLLEVQDAVEHGVGGVGRSHDGVVHSDAFPIFSHLALSAGVAEELGVSIGVGGDAFKGDAVTCEVVQVALVGRGEGEGGTRIHIPKSDVVAAVVIPREFGTLFLTRFGGGVVCRQVGEFRERITVHALIGGIIESGFPVDLPDVGIGDAARCAEAVVSLVQLGESRFDVFSRGSVNLNAVSALHEVEGSGLVLVGGLVQHVGGCHDILLAAEIDDGVEDGVGSVSRIDHRLRQSNSLPVGTGRCDALILGGGRGVGFALAVHHAVAFFVEDGEEFIVAAGVARVGAHEIGAVGADVEPLSHFANVADGEIAVGGLREGPLGGGAGERGGKTESLGNPLFAHTTIYNVLVGDGVANGVASVRAGFDIPPRIGGDVGGGDIIVNQRRRAVVAAKHHVARAVESFADEAILLGSIKTDSSLCAQQECAQSKEKE